MEPTSLIEIDLAAIDHNLDVVRTSLGGGRKRPRPGVCAVLKADAYALGAVRLARRLEGLGVDMIAVYTPQQARELIDASIGTPILMLMPIRGLKRDDRLYRAACRGQLHLTVHDAPNLESLVAIADGLGISLPVHLELDTGMSRGGVPIGQDRSQAGGLLARIDEHPRLRLAGIYTHFASADRDEALTRTQHDRFTRWLAARRDLVPPECLVHEASTFGVFRARTYHARMVRVGLALLGYAEGEFADPDEFELRRFAARLRPALRWTSRVVQLKDVGRRATVGYRSTWRAKRPTRLALVPVGYADGYPLALSNKGVAGIELPGGAIEHAPVVGRVSMDQLTLDVTDLPRDAVRLGTTVELISALADAPNALPALASSAGTISHELLCRLSPRVPRAYSVAIGEHAARRHAESTTNAR